MVLKASPPLNALGIDIKHLRVYIGSMGKQPIFPFDWPGAAAAPAESGPGCRGKGQLKGPRQKRPRSFYARLARARGVPLRTVYLELNPDKRPRLRAAQESDDWLPWSRLDLVRMDRRFCDAMRRAIARGTELPRDPAAKPIAARVLRRLDAVPLWSGATSPAELCAEIGEPDPFDDSESGDPSMDTHTEVRPKTNFCKIELVRTLALQMLAATPS